MIAKRISFWTLIESQIHRFEDKVCFLYDKNGSFYDDEHIPTSADFYIFDTIEEAEIFIDKSNMDIVENFTKTWVKGIVDNSLIYKLRG